VKSQLSHGLYSPLLYLPGLLDHRRPIIYECIYMKKAIERYPRWYRFVLNQRADTCDGSWWSMKAVMSLFSLIMWLNSKFYNSSIIYLI